MIYCGFGYDFGKVFVPDPDNLEKFSNNQKMHKILPFQYRKQLIFQKVALSSSFGLLLLNFLLVPEQDPEPYCISVQQKVPVSAVPIPGPHNTDAMNCDKTAGN
jgi:hypothetical protein